MLSERRCAEEMDGCVWMVGWLEEEDSIAEEQALGEVEDGYRLCGCLNRHQGN